MITTIIFDIGGVLLRTEDRTSRQQLEAWLGLAAGRSEFYVFNSEMGKKAQQGEATTAELWAWIQRELKLSYAELRAFQRDFWGGDVLDLDMVELIRQLRAAGNQTAVISNYSDILPYLLHEKWEIGELFDLIVVSAEEGVTKPEAAIFERTLARLGIAGETAVFIDDFAHNVKGAQEAGLHAIHFTPQTNLATKLVALGVKTG